MDRAVLKEFIPKAAKEKYARPDNLIGAHHVLQEAWIKHLDSNEFSLSEAERAAAREKRNDSLAKGGAILARTFGAVPSWGVNPEPRVDQAEVAFTETIRKTSDIPTVTINPWASEPFTLDLEISAVGSDTLFGELARMKEANGTGVKMATSFSLTSEGKLTSWEKETERTMSIEVYRGGKELYALRVDKEGKVVGASRFNYKDEDKPEPAIPAIPTRERRRVFFYNREKADITWPEDDPSAIKVDATAEFEGKTIDLEELDGIFRTVDDKGNLLKQPDLATRINEVLSIKI